MFMLRSIAPAMFLRSLYLTRFTSGYLLRSCFTAYAANVNSEKENTIRGVFADYSHLFAFLRVELRALLITGSLLRVRKVRRGFNLRVDRARNIPYSRG